MAPGKTPGSSGPAVGRFLATALSLAVEGALASAEPEGSGTSPSIAPAPSRVPARETAKARLLRLGDLEDPPEVHVGERLFLETRFAEFFHRNFDGNVNHPLLAGDPSVAQLPTPGGPIAGPFAGKSMSCRNCHLVDDAPGATTSTYGDYARRSAVPERGDGKTRTPRSSPPMVNAFLDRDGFVLHFDGQFATEEDLIRDTFTGRNFGWLPDETDVAIAHLARVIREDDGTDDLAPQYGKVSYRVLLAGTDPAIAPDSRIPPAYRIDVLKASDCAVLDAVAALIAAYLRSLTFSQDENGLYNGSPYDLFLAKNGLPRSPAPGEAELDDARRLRDAVEGLAAPAHRYPERADLGAWNIFANPDFPAPQPALRSLLAPLGDTPEAVLPRTIGLFKTPGLRDLGQSAPYLHTGRKREIEDVFDFYREIAAKARRGKVRNASPELASITLGEDDVAPLAAFLRSLNEDYN